jgi:hypothetical protein
MEALSMAIEFDAELFITCFLYGGALSAMQSRKRLDRRAYLAADEALRALGRWLAHEEKCGIAWL